MKARMSHYPGQEHQGRRTLVLDLDVPWHDLGCSCLGGIISRRIIMPHAKGGPTPCNHPVLSTWENFSSH